jgi:hypothetical protein
MEIRLMDHVLGTASNGDGERLFLVLVNPIQNKQTVVLSLEGVRGFSSSFLNSSFGELISRYGVDAVRSGLRLSHYRPSVAQSIANYIDQAGQLIH